MSTFYADSASIDRLSVTNLTAVSSSILYFTASALNVAESFISVNVFEPLQRFGGIRVYDSGSSLDTASLAWDSLNNRWVYQNVAGATYNGGMLMSGPRNTGSLGEETSLTRWFIARSDGGDHLNNTQIYSSASIHIVTGSLTVTEGITGSLSGTASFATSASYAPYSTGNLASVQARRTTGYTLTNSVVAITMDVTDVENQPTVVSHDNTNTERIYVYSTGLYLIHYHADVGPGTVSDFEFAVSKNGSSNNISGSLVAGKNSSTDKIVASADVLTLLDANDYVTLVARYPATSTGVANNVVFSVTKMEGVAGPQGPSGPAGAPGGVTSIIAGTNITISPVSGTGDVTINSTAAGGGSVDLGAVLAITRVTYPFSGF